MLTTNTEANIIDDRQQLISRPPPAAYKVRIGQQHQISPWLSKNWARNDAPIILTSLVLSPNHQVPVNVRAVESPDYCILLFC